MQRKKSFRKVRESKFGRKSNGEAAEQFKNSCKKSVKKTTI